jgi:glycosyltransferase involved in cell wall biosynthesis
MKIAVNTRLLLKGKLEGIGRFSLEILRRLVENHPEHEFVFIFDRKPAPEFIFCKNVKAVVARPQARHPLLWYLFFEFGVYRVLKREKPDVFFSPDGWISLKSEVPTLNTIHDLNFEEHPEFLPPYIVKYYKKFFPRFARESSRLLTVSEYTKVDISKRYGVDPLKIDVVYNAANTAFRKLDEEQKLAVREKYTEGKDYFLFVGLIHPRKNLFNQLKAFEKFKLKTGSDYKFLVVGDRYSTTPELDDFLKTSTYSKDIIFAGRLGIDELVNVYGAAFALMYVSYFEGFGIPIVEAFKAEIPVVTSDRTSMPEISGKGGLIVDPDNNDMISKAMLKLFESGSLRQQLVEEGKALSGKFNWDQSAERVMEALEKTAQA